MSVLTVAPRQQPGVAGTPPAAVPFRYTQTENFPDLLKQLGASLLVTTYQANKLLVVREAGGRLSTLVRTFERPMGLAGDARRLALCTHHAIWFLRNAPDIAPRLEPPGLHDACYLPRSCHVTGDIAGHEIAWAGECRSVLEKLRVMPLHRGEMAAQVGDKAFCVRIAQEHGNARDAGAV